MSLEVVPPDLDLGALLATFCFGRPMSFEVVDLAFCFGFCSVTRTLLLLASGHRLSPTINPTPFSHPETFWVRLHSNLVNGHNIDLFSCHLKVAHNPCYLDFVKVPSNMRTVGEAPIEINRLTSSKLK